MSPKIKRVTKLSEPIPNNVFSGASKSILLSGLSKSLLFWMFIFTVDLKHDLSQLLCSLLSFSIYLQEEKLNGNFAAL